MPYLGNTPTTQSFISGTDYFNGTGAQTAFTLTRTVASVNDIEAVVNNVVQQPNDAYTISGTTITFTSAPSAGTNNVYVRYLSTTTQAITPSQNTVNYNTFDSNMQSAIGTGMKNRIINGAMTISQRNGTSSITPTADDTFTLDRWAARISAASKLSFQQDAGAVTPPVGFSDYLGCTSLSAYSVTSTDYFALTQGIEGFNTADLNWGTANAKTITLSFWVRSSLTGTFSGALLNDTRDRVYPFTYTITSANTWELETITITGDTSGTWTTNNSAGIYVRFSLGAGSTRLATAGSWQTTAGAIFGATGTTSVVGTNGATFYITGVQLEVGTQATSFEYRQYQQELALCQRYAYKISGSNAFSPLTGAGQGTAATTVAFTVPAKVSMRATPSLLTTGNLCVTANGLNSLTAVTSMDIYRAIPENPMVQATVASGITAGVCYFLHGNNDTTASLLISAEL